MKKLIKTLIFKILGGKCFVTLQGIYWSRKLRGGNVCEEEINFLRGFIEPGDAVIDIGANCGQYTYHFSKLVGNSGKVLSIEPGKDALSILKNVVLRSRLENVDIRNVALSDKDGEFEFVTPFDEQNLPAIGEAHLRGKAESSNDNTEKVKVTTLDKLASEFTSKHRVTFVKCDVEGCELMVLKGGKSLLSEYKPVVLCEVQEEFTSRYGCKPRELEDFLGLLGYKIFTAKPEGLVQVERVESSMKNYFFVPCESIEKLGL